MASDKYKPGGRYAILITGHVAKELSDVYGNYGDMFVKLLADEGEQWEFITVEGKQPPPEDELAAYDGLVLTGSGSDSFSSEPWIHKLTQGLQAAIKRRQRTLGICFGHQVMAIALGGRTARQSAFEGGTRTVQTSEHFQQHWAAQGEPSGWSFRIHETHSDAVTQMPPEAQLLASSHVTKVEAMAAGDFFLGVQGHPEFTEAFQRALLEYRLKAGTLTQAQRDDSIASMDSNPLTPEDFKSVQALLKRFLKTRHRNG